MVQITPPATSPSAAFHAVNAIVTEGLNQPSLKFTNVSHVDLLDKCPFRELHAPDCCQSSKEDHMSEFRICSIAIVRHHAKDQSV